MSEIKFKELVFSVIKSCEKIWNKDKTELKENLLINLLENYDEEIISLLLENERIKKKFFVKINEIYIFKINDFKFFIEENKINNSYTEYKNLIGLSDGNRFLKHSNDIVLDFPFKDCILQGGQTAEDKKDFYYEYDEKVSETNKKKYKHKEKNYNKKENKRNEIFFNKIIAEDEIDRLFDEKTLINFKKFDKNGEKKLDEFKRNKNGTIKDNLIIKGNNLIALHSLKKQFAGKIKLIYIDPPYNTGNDGFMYNDNFNHSTWLTFMKNRLEIAKELLRNDGVIFVSIDDNEMAYLKILMDEIFGRENFISTLSVENNPKGRKNSNHISTTNEFCLIYAKNKSNKNSFFKENLAKDKKTLKIDELNRFYTSGRRVLIGESSNNPVTNFNSKKHYTVYYNKIKNEIIIKTENNENEKDNNLISKGYKRFFSYKNKSFLENTYTKNEFQKLFNKKALIFKENTVYEKDFNKFIRMKSLIKNDKLNDLDLKTETAGKDLRKFGLNFPNPKNTGFIKLLLSLLKSKNDIILDFHAGSGTTAHAVLKQNKEDGGNRKFILVEQMDYVNTITCPRVQKVLERENLDNSFIYFELKENNKIAEDNILSCSSLSELKSFFEILEDKYFLNYNLNTRKFFKVIDEDNFKKLSLERQKKIFISMLDLNQMYVCKSEMEDSMFQISEEDKKLNWNFYNENN